MKSILLTDFGWVDPYDEWFSGEHFSIIDLCLFQFMIIDLLLHLQYILSEVIARWFNMTSIYIVRIWPNA